MRPETECQRRTTTTTTTNQTRTAIPAHPNTAKGKNAQVKKLRASHAINVDILKEPKHAKNHATPEGLKTARMRRPKPTTSALKKSPQPQNQAAVRTREREESPQAGES
jgi:hypothetical protein